MCFPGRRYRSTEYKGYYGVTGKEMDLDYEKYMPKEYFLDGFDATENNPVAQERRKFIEEHSE